ncbi:hypothetical protein KAJ02_06105, partial [Candidatus Bipolaricaulota bacterium]|nr:hypothetical protein [Candidatus Bipolaricaulota bacterium]
GAFTYYLLEAMTGLADLYGNRDGLISAEECLHILGTERRQLHNICWRASSPEDSRPHPGRIRLR